MSLINCLAKSRFSNKERDYILAKSKELEEKGVPKDEAARQVVATFQKDLLDSLKDIYKELDIPLTKKAYEGTTRIDQLKPMRIVYKKGKTILEFEEWNKLSKKEKEGYTEVTKPAQVILTWPYKNIDIASYLDENGYLDGSRLSPELLNIFGFRIPNQGHSSMSLLEVVGVIPNTIYSDMVIAPKEFVTQMGSDFDIDKLYVYQYKLKLAPKEKLPNGKIKKRKLVAAKTVQNRILDIHKAVMYNPEVFNRVVTPLPSIHDSPVGQELKSRFDKGVDNYLLPSYSGTKYLESVDGKAMVGRDALFTTFMSTLQNGNVQLAKPVEVETPTGVKLVQVPVYFKFKYDNQVFEVNNVSTATDVTDQPKKNNMSAQLSGAVDNESNPIIAFINSNPTTSSVKHLLTALGVPNDFIFKFLTQPVIKEYVKRAKQGRANGVYENITLTDLIADQIKKTDNAILHEEFDPLEYPLSIEDLNGSYSDIIADDKASVLFERIQYITLKQFEFLKQYGDVLSTAATLGNIDSNGVGTSVVAIVDKTERLEDVINNKKFIGLEVLKDTEATISGLAIEYALRPAKAYLTDSNLLPYDKLVGVYKYIEQQTGNKQLSIDTKEEIFNEAKALIFSSMFHPDYRNKLFFDTPTNKSLATQLKEWKKHPIAKRNQFLIRLNVKRSKRPGKPSLIVYNAYRKDDVDTQIVYQGFLDLLNNDNAEVRVFARQLVDYFYLLGGIQQAREFGKFISPRYLQAVGMLKTIKELPFTSEYLEENDFVTQYFQHKPFRAIQLPASDYKQVSFTGAPNIENATSVTVKATVGKDRLNSLVYTLPDGSMDYVSIFTVKKKDGSYSIFKAAGEERKEGERYIKYKKIETKGSPGYREYNAKPVEEVQETKPSEKKGYKEVPVTTEIETKEIPTRVNDNLDGYLDKNALEALAKIKSNTILASYLRRLSFLSNVKVIGEDIEGKGRYNSSTNTITLGVNTNNSRKEAENTLLHEILHAAITAVDKGWVNATATQREAINRVKLLRQTIIDKVMNNELVGSGYKAEELKEFNDLYAKFVDKTATAEDVERMKELFKYYPLVSSAKESIWQEFTNGLFDSRQTEFRAMLNSVRYDSKKSFLDRLNDLIVTIVKGFKALYGIEVASESALEEALYDTLAILDKPETEEFNKTDSKENADYFLYSIERDKTENEIAKKYNGIINDFNNRIKLLERSIITEKAVKNKVEVVKLEQRLKEVKEELNGILDNGSYEYLVAIGKTDLDYVERVLDQPTVSPRDLNYTEAVIATYLNITKPEYGLISEEALSVHTERKKQLRELEARAYTLNKEHSRIALNSLVEVIRTESGVEGITNEIIAAHKPLNLGTAYFMDLSRTGDITLSTLHKMLKDADYRANLQYQEISNKIDKLIGKVLDNKLFKEKGWDLFFQKEEGPNGAKVINGRLIDKISDKYHKERKRLFEAAKKAPKGKDKQRAWAIYYKWIRDNHYVFNLNKLVKVEDRGTLIFKPDNTYIEELKGLFGKDYDRLIKEQIDKIQRYNEALETKIISLQGDPRENAIIEQWIDENSPLRYFEALNNYKITVVDGKRIKRNGWKYIVRRVNENWEDPDYKVLEKEENKELLEFYNYVVETLYDLYSYVPHELREEFGGKSIPHIAKNIGEVFKDQGMQGARTFVHDLLIKGTTFTNDEKDIINSPVSPVDSKVDKQLRIKYLTKLESSEITTDLGRVLRMFSKEAMAYKYKSAIEDKVRLAHSVLSKSLEYNINANGERVKNRWGNFITTKQESAYKDMLDYVLDTFYGARKAKELTTKQTKVFGKKLRTAKEEKAYQSELAAIDNNKLLSDEQKAEQKAEVESKYTRYISGGKLIDGFLQYVQIKAMGWNPFSAINNIIFGWLSNYTYASGGRDFTTKELLEANRIMLASVVGIGDTEPRVAKKIRSLMIKMDTLKEILETAYRDTSDNNRLGSLLNPLEAQRRGEYFVQGMTMVALMLGTKINVDGKTTNVWEAFDEEGNWKYSNKEEWGAGDLDNKEENKKLFSFKTKLDQINKKLHGNYDPSSPVLIKKWVLGRALMQFRSWMAEGIASRYEERKYDLYLEREVEGRYRTMARLGASTTLKTLFKQLITANSDTAFDELNLQGDDLELVKENMKRNLSELMQKVSMVALSVVLSKLDDDDDKEWSNYVLNILYRVGDDIEFYSSPIAFQNITRTAIPSAVFIGDVYKFLDAIYEAIIHKDEIKTGTYAGESRLLLRAAKLVPFGSSITTNVAKLRNTEEFRN